MTMSRYIEDFQAGETFETGTELVSEGEAIAYAETYDPQSFHLDRGLAEGHPLFKGLAVSGFLVLGITHRLVLAEHLGQAWGLIGKRVRDLTWRRPVRPGDILRARGRVIDTSHKAGLPIGTLEVEIKTVNQHDEVVMAFTVETVVPSRTVREISI